MKSCLFVINPNAGLRQSRRMLTDLLFRLNRAGYLCSVFVTGNRGDAVNITREYAGQTDLVVACGGDGTLNEVITGLLTGGHETPLGYLPCGSTNDFAAGLGLPGDLMEACEDIACGIARPLDIGRFGPTRFFSYTASFGAFTSVSYSTPQNVKNVLGHAAYILEGIRSLADIRPIHMKVEANGHIFEEDYVFGAVCNSTSLGGVLKLENSGVHMNDGLFEALLIPFPSDLIALNAVLNALRTHDYANPCLTFVRSSGFTFRSESPVSWTLDGEEAQGDLMTVIENLHSAVHLVSRRETVGHPD